MYFEETPITVHERVQDGVRALWGGRGNSGGVAKQKGVGALTLTPLNVTSGVKCLQVAVGKL